MPQDMHARFADQTEKMANGSLRDDEAVVRGAFHLQMRSWKY